MNKTQRKEFLNENWRFKTLNFKWSRSGICHLYNKRSEKTGFSAGGGGYDMKGSVFGSFINEYFQNEIKRLKTSDFYGLTHWNTKTKKRQNTSSKFTKTYVDGACGFSTMERILNKIGFKLNFVLESNSQIVYTLESK